MKKELEFSNLENLSLKEDVNNKNQVLDQLKRENSELQEKTKILE